MRRVCGAPDAVAIQRQPPPQSTPTAEGVEVEDSDSSSDESSSSSSDSSSSSASSPPAAPAERKMETPEILSELELAKQRIAELERRLSGAT